MKKKVYVSVKEDFLVSLVEKSQSIDKIPELSDMTFSLKHNEKVEEERKAKEYTQSVSRNVEIMGDLIWRYSPTEEMEEKLKESMNASWLTLMDRMKRIMQLCDIDSPLNYGAIYSLDQIKQKIIQRELEVIRGRYKLEEYTKSFVILENYYVRGETI